MRGQVRDRGHAAGVVALEGEDEVGQDEVWAEVREGGRARGGFVGGRFFGEGDPVARDGG